MNKTKSGVPLSHAHSADDDENEIQDKFAIALTLRYLKNEKKKRTTKINLILFPVRAFTFEHCVDVITRRRYSEPTRPPHQVLDRKLSKTYPFSISLRRSSPTIHPIAIDPRKTRENKRHSRTHQNTTI